MTRVRKHTRRTRAGRTSVGAHMRNRTKVATYGFANKLTAAKGYRAVRDKNGTPYRFSTKEEAETALRAHARRHNVSPKEYVVLPFGDDA